MKVGVSRATAEQTNNSNMADLRSRIDYEEATQKRDPREMAEVRAISRSLSRNAVLNLDSYDRIKWLRGAVSPARLDVGLLGPLAKYTATQRVAMVRSWNLGARFVFKEETVALPRATTNGAFGSFTHTLWTADARTANGDVYLGGKSGTFRCIRCPKTDATQIPINVKSAKDIPNGVAEPGLTLRDGNVYMPPTKDSKPNHFDSHSARALIPGFPWLPYETYESLIVENDFKRTSLMNTKFDYVVIPPLFAVYLTPHYHGYHASTQSCHRGFGLFKSSSEYGACFKEAYGDVVYGKRPVNRAAFVLHSAVHAARPDINAAAHSHSVYGKAWSALGRTLDPITQDACAFYNDHSVITDAAGKVVFEIEDGERFAECFSSGKAAIHQNHGLFTAAETVDAAAYWFISMERSCQAQLLAEAAGTPKLIPHEWAQYTRDNTAHQLAGWLNFQPLWDDICLSDPDLFD